MSERSKIGFGDALSDLGSFAPSQRTKPAPAPEAASAAGFTSREPVAPPTPKQQRRRRTGRNAQINIKTTPECIAEFYALADDNAWGIGEAFEMAVELLKQKANK